MFCCAVVFLSSIAWRTRKFKTGSRTLCDSKPINELQLWNSNKKVVVYSLFSPTSESDEADFPYFLEGLLQNAKDARLYYPDWIVRVYVIGLDEKTEEMLQTAPNVEVVRCNDNSPLTTSASRKMMTRFLAIDDKQVLYALFRDADSRLGPRELFAVNEWISSGLGFHVMRDHSQHSVPVLGGMFGTKRGVIKKSVERLIWDAIASNPGGLKGVRGEDQSFLRSYVWDLTKSACLAHDIDLERCTQFGAKICKDFPYGVRSVDKNVFVGAMFKHEQYEDASMHYECDHQCIVAPSKSSLQSET